MSFDADFEVGDTPPVGSPNHWFQSTSMAVFVVPLRWVVRTRRKPSETPLDDELILTVRKKHYLSILGYLVSYVFNGNSNANPVGIWGS